MISLSGELGNTVKTVRITENSIWGVGKNTNLGNWGETVYKEKLWRNCAVHVRCVLSMLFIQHCVPERHIVAPNVTAMGRR